MSARLPPGKGRVANRNGKVKTLGIERQGVGPQRTIREKTVSVSTYRLVSSGKGLHAVRTGTASTTVDPPPVTQPDDPSSSVEVHNEIIETVAKQRVARYRAVDRMLDWIPFRQLYLDELIRRDGLGGQARDPSGSPPLCPGCPSSAPRMPAKYRCRDCDGGHLVCGQCMVADHRHRSLHAIEFWNGKFFEKSSLRELGLEVQLGHYNGECSNSGRHSASFVVGHTNGFHEVNVVFCACVGETGKVVPEWAQLLRYGWYPASRHRTQTAFSIRLLDFFHELTLQGKTSLHDFHRTLCRIADNSGVGIPWNLYKQLSLVVRQWRNLMLFKRHGRGHDPGGIAETVEGSCVVECAACPHPGRNLPEGWENAPAEVAWMYALFLMLDANFRLKLKDRGFKDVDLAAGCGYFVEDTKYQRFIQQSGVQQEINTCSAEHKAIRNANVPHGGYLASGTAACLCNRHLLVRANGLADLQKGEKYCTMDYILLCTLIGTCVSLFITYDIACQYSKNFARRVEQFPPCMRLDPRRAASTRWAIPKKHFRVHGEKNHSQLSLNYSKYCGRTYGEGIETGWAHMNPVSMSTKEMPPAARREVIDDHWGSWNWQKTLAFGILFLRNLQTAGDMRVKQELVFDEFTNTFPPETIAQWQAKVELWESDPTAHEDLFVENNKATTLNEIKLKLANEEAREVASGITSPHEVSASLFLQMGLEIEDTQRMFQVRARAKHSVSDLVALQNKRNSLANRITSWRKIQEIYTPVTIPLVDEWNASHTPPSEDDSESDIGSVHAEDIPLFLPSSLPPGLRQTGSISPLLRKEACLREAIADDSLADIRRLRRTMAGITLFKHLNVSGTGQKGNTRVRTLYAKFQDKVTAAALRYRAAFAALEILLPNGDWKHRLQPLRDSDITGPGNDNDDRPLGEGHRVVSWIWRVPLQSTSDECDNPEDFNQSMQVEWAKTRARARRWAEEFELIQEEMRRVIVFFEWKAQWWRDQAGRRSGNVQASLASGLSAYAEKQASMYDALSLKFYNMWNPYFTIRRLLAESAAAHAMPVDDARRRFPDLVDSGDESASGAESD